MNARRLGMPVTLCWALAAAVGCGNRPMEDSASIRPIHNAARAFDPAPPAPSAAPTSPLKKPSLQGLKFTLPEGWKATYDGVSRWKIEGDAPPDFPVVLIWSVPEDLAPGHLITFCHKLQTSTALTEGKYILDRATEQGNFSSGYYVVGRFRPRGDRRTQNLGLAMIRKLGGHTLIFECMKVNDPEQRQEVLDICKSARF